MNARTIQLLLLLGVGLFGFAFFTQWRSSNQQRREIERLQATLRRLETQVRTSQRSLDPAEKTRRTNALNRMPGQTTIAPLPSVENPAPPEPAGMSGLLAKMMEDPDMRRMVVQQQKTVMDNLYAPLFKELALSPAETDQFKNLVLTNQLRNMERAGDLMKGLAEPASRDATFQKVVQQAKEGDEEMKALLGEQRFAHYREYNETMGDRLTIQQLKQQLLSATPLRDDQEFQLHRIMREEAKKMPLPPGEDNPGVRSWSMIVSDEAMENQFHRQQEINKRVLERAQAVLSDEQLETFRKFQLNQLQMQRMGVTMARKMMGTRKAPAASAEQPPGDRPTGNSAGERNPP